MKAETISLISTTVLIVTVLILTKTCCVAYRPYIGIIKVDTDLNKEKMELTSTVKIKNSGNVPANKVKTNMRTYCDDDLLSTKQGVSEFVLFPGQETSGVPQFQNVNSEVLSKHRLYIEVEITYQQPITFFYSQKFETYQRLEYGPKTGRWASVSGKAN